MSLPSCLHWASRLQYRSSFWILLVCYCFCIPWVHLLEFLSSPPPPIPGVYESQNYFAFCTWVVNYRIEFYENKKKYFFSWNFHSIAVLQYWSWFFKICWVCKFSNLNLIILWFLWILPCSRFLFFLDSLLILPVRISFMIQFRILTSFLFPMFCLCIHFPLF